MLSCGFDTWKDILDVVVMPVTLTTIGLVANGILQDWRARDLYVGLMPGGGMPAPVIKLGKDGLVDGAFWHGVFRVVNTASETDAIEGHRAVFGPLKLRGIPQLDMLADQYPTIKTMPSPYKHPQAYDSGAEHDDSCYVQPVVVPANGGKVFLKVESLHRFRSSR